MLTNVPTDLLRAFVTVVDLGSYTKAAEVLGRTQPAVSLQIRRLEDILRTRLLNTEGKQVRLTTAGGELGPLARQMLRLNDDMIAHFANETLSGWIRVGLPTDFSNTFLLNAITQFAADNPEVRLEVESMLSSDLRLALAAEQLNSAIGIAPSGEDVYLVNSAVVRPIWAMADSFQCGTDQPLPIIRHPDPCEYAERMRAAMRGSKRTWKTVLVSSDVAGIQSALLAGLGTSALTPATLLPGLRIGREEEGFPPLEPLRVGLFYKHARLSKAGHGLAQWLMEQIGAAGQGLGS